MKKMLFTLMGLLSLTVSAQDKGRFEVYDYNDFKLHVYYTNDVMGDASYIIEGRNALATLEQPLFKDNVQEYDAYLKNLGKPVEARIADYHLGGTGSENIVMVKGMPAFTKEGVYGAMMEGFAKAFGDAIVSLPTGKADEVDFESAHTYAGVPFRFSRGASTDFPGAGILIGGQVYFTHWAPMKVHANNLYISSREGIDARIAELEQAQRSGASLYIGGHGGAEKAEAVAFKIAYLKKLKETFTANTSATAFVAAMKAAYPELPGAEGLDALAQALYK